MGVGVQTGKNPYGERVWRVPGSKHFSILGEVENNNKKKPYILGADVHPGKDLCDPQHPFGHLTVSDIGLYCAPDYKEPDDCSRQKSHHRVETQEDSNLRVSDSSPFPVDAKPAKFI